MSTTDPRLTRQTLIQRLKADPSEADWRHFQTFYWDVVTGWARQRGCPPDMAEDIYQETVISLMRYLEVFDPSKAKFRSFLKTIAIRRIEDAWRRQYKGPRDAAKRELESRRPLVDDLEELPVYDDATMQLDESIWLAGVVTEALRRTYSRIDDVTYKSFCHNLFESDSADSIAEKLKVSRNAVYNHKNRSMKILCAEVIRILEDLGDQGLPTVPDGPEAMANLRAALEAYLANRRDLRETTDTLVLPSTLVARLDQFARILSDHPPTSNAPLLRVIRPDHEDWEEMHDEMIIGRRDSATLRLSDSSVSGQHARIDETDSGWRVTDCNSTHGTWINGTRKAEAILVGGDQIQIGANFLVFIPN